MQLPSFLHALKKDTSTIPAVHHRLSSSSHRHFRILIGIFALLFCIVVSGSFFLLYAVRENLIFTVDTAIAEKQPLLLKESLLRSTNEIFDQKSKRRAALEANPITYPDPSL